MPSRSAAGGGGGDERLSPPRAFAGNTPPGDGVGAAGTLVSDDGGSAVVAVSKGSHAWRWVTSTSSPLPWGRLPTERGGEAAGERGGHLVRRGGDHSTRMGRTGARSACHGEEVGTQRIKIVFNSKQVHSRGREG